MDPNGMFLIILVLAMVLIMFWQSRNAKKQRSKQDDFRTNLKPGDKVATLSGLIGNIVEVDLDHDQVVLDSEGSRSRWRIQAITEAPVEPKYVSDEEYERSQQEATEAQTDQDAQEQTADAAEGNAEGVEEAPAAATEPSAEQEESAEQSHK
ncbi:hypothetical protein GCM10007377_03300 [Galliscardovia ingluviei]|uniref:Preprotein translocase subunit YajC n=1 Tax=Galliscardovia ingluviei TaxID=1769422 RepID=A0A8J3F127_9BIFI|nr:preprotein translocase subunit YajC [Galliscardovia ingluviei]GGI12906.1 hypothetical protein GCM10007377_03300 [Galliscardovia ingluviei]